MASAGIVSALFPGPLNVNTTLTDQTSIAQGCFIEMFLTAELVFVIFMLAAEKHKATFLAPVGIGLALFIAELSGVYFTGGSLNPARSFGPAAVTGQFPGMYICLAVIQPRIDIVAGYHWIYWIGPVLGSLLATGFYKLMKYGEYQ
jgi:aquaporin related protein